VNYKTALQLNPNHTVALVNMGRHLRAAGNIREAEQTYKRFVLRHNNSNNDNSSNNIGNSNNNNNKTLLYPKREEFTILYQSKNDRGAGYLK